MAKHGRKSAFVIEAQISTRTFYRWLKERPAFCDCFYYGYELAYQAWELQGELGKNELEFNFSHWKFTGMEKFNIGIAKRVRMDIDPTASPIQQYQQLVASAANGEYTSSEIKQMMESLNIGSRVYELFKMQEDLDKMKIDINRMELHSGNNIIPIESSKKKDQNTLPN